MMPSVLFDTNIVIDDLNGVPQARAELRTYAIRAISVVSFMEVLAGVKFGQEDATRALLDSFTLVSLDETVAERAVLLGRRRRLDWPDAIIWATAQVHDMLLITRNTQDFPAGDPGIRVPYTL